jgi:transposase-like protein
MPKQTRRNHSAAFKAKVALEAVRGEKTVAELSAKCDVHPTLINQWKRTLSEQASAVFEKDGGQDEKKTEQLVDTLYKQIGQLKVENDFLAVRLKR